MSVIVEFSHPTEDFMFGNALNTTTDMRIELEAIIPVDEGAMPYFWATGDDFETFEQKVLETSSVESITKLDQVGDHVLYRVVWPEVDGMLRALVQSNAVILEAHSNHDWHFRVRFPDHDCIGDFYNFCLKDSLDINVERVYSLLEGSRSARPFKLSQEQHEALILAVNGGYFEVPRRTNLTEIADELGISQQAASQRVRRGADRVFQAVLFDSTEKSWE